MSTIVVENKTKVGFRVSVTAHFFFFFFRLSLILILNEI